MERGALGILADALLEELHERGELVRVDLGRDTRGIALQPEAFHRLLS
jgi:hypothetical protein